MVNRVQHSRPPVVLFVDDQEWSARSLESVLAPNGYAVMRAYTARKGLERAKIQPPDVLFINTNLPDGDGIALCQTLRDDPEFSSTIPILVTNPERPTREQRLAALEAGAWEFVSYPIDAQALLLRLDAYVRAKFEADRSGEQGLIDHLTGLYNLRGLERRERELRSQAYRDRKPLACLVLSPTLQNDDVPVDDGEITEAVERLGKALRDLGRGSDAIGRVGQTEFVILAPSTDRIGAVKLAERLAEAMWGAGGNGNATHAKPFRAGYDAVANVRETPGEARDLLLHATIALRNTKAAGREDGEEWIRPFESRSRASLS